MMFVCCALILTFLCGFVLACRYLLNRMVSLESTSITRKRDVEFIQWAYSAELLHRRNPFNVQDVNHYYSLTTKRDYALLETWTGPGMHTILDDDFCPIISQGRNYVQPMMIHGELKRQSHIYRPRVLEIGCGKGVCANLLAELNPNAIVVGIDLVKEHIDEAKEQQQPGASFVQGNILEMNMNRRFDFVYGIESLCHMDTPDKRNDLLKKINQMMPINGRFMIIDGFRESGFYYGPNPNPNPMEFYDEFCMRCAETGFHINYMPSMDAWKMVAYQNGFELVYKCDLTEKATSFWRLGWKVMHGMTRLFPWFFKWIAHTKTGSNVLSILTTYHAFVTGKAEYGTLVFRKCKNV